MRPILILTKSWSPRIWCWPRFWCWPRWWWGWWWWWGGWGWRTCRYTRPSSSDHMFGSCRYGCLGNIVYISNMCKKIIYCNIVWFEVVDVAAWWHQWCIGSIMSGYVADGHVVVFNWLLLFWLLQYCCNEWGAFGLLTAPVHRWLNDWK